MMLIRERCGCSCHLKQKRYYRSSTPLTFFRADRDHVVQNLEQAVEALFGMPATWLGGDRSRRGIIVYRSNFDLVWARPGDLVAALLQCADFAMPLGRIGWEKTTPFFWP